MNAISDTKKGIIGTILYITFLFTLTLFLDKSSYIYQMFFDRTPTIEINIYTQTNTVMLPATITKTPSNTSSITPTSVLISFVITDVLNLRSGPGMEFSIISGLIKNTKIIILGSTNTNWYQIKTEDGTTGWVNGDYIDKNFDEEYFVGIQNSKTQTITSTSQARDTKKPTTTSTRVLPTKKPTNTPIPRNFYSTTGYYYFSTSTPVYVQPTQPLSTNCHPSYPSVCIPYPPPDLDCADIPYRRFAVVGSDPHNFDGDGDGIGCEW